MLKDNPDDPPGPRLTPRQELETRRARFGEALQNAGIDLAVVTTPAHVY